MSFQTNRYSVPFTLIGQTVEVSRQGAELHIFHRGALVACHPLLVGEHQMRILPEHGPGAIARNARRRQGIVPQSNITSPALCEVEVRDLALLRAVARGGGSPMNAGQFERITEHLQRLRLFKSRERLEALREAGESPRVELRGLASPRC